MLGLHCLGNLSHLDGGSGRAAVIESPPPLRDDNCRERQLDVMQERPASDSLGSLSRWAGQNAEARRQRVHELARCDARNETLWVEATTCAGAVASSKVFPFVWGGNS